MEASKKENDIQETRIYEEHFTFYLLMLRKLGVSLVSRNNSEAYTLYSALTVLCAYSFFAAIILDMLRHRHDLQHTMQNVHACTGILCTLWIHQSFRLQKNKFVKLMVLTSSFIWEDLPGTSNDGETSTMAAKFPLINKLVKQMVIFVFVIHGTSITIRLMTSEQRELTANSFYLFDVSRSPVYELIFLSQIIAAVFYTFVFFAFWGLYATFVCIACSQLEKLRASLLDIRQRQDTAERDSGADTDQEEEGQVHSCLQPFRHMQEQLNDCVRHHQQILRFMNAMEDALNPVLLGLFFIATFSICLSAFSIVMNLGDAMPMVQAALVYVAMMFLLFPLCQLGEELTQQASSIADAVWNSNWVGTPVSFQRCLVLINAAANKTFILTAGKFVPVSNKTMVNIFNQTISFLMFLLEMNKPSVPLQHDSTAT